MSYKTTKGLIKLSFVLIFAISIFYPKSSVGYNKSWDQGHQCVNPTGGQYGWGKYDKEGVFHSGYETKRCCEELCKVCPVYANTGRLQLSFTDLSIRGIGPAFNITRTYDSQDWSTGLLGHSWTFNFGKKITIIRNSNNEKILGIKQDTGEKNFFIEHPDGTLELLAGYGVTYNLVKKTDDTYTINNLDGSKYEINQDGKIKKIVDQNGNELVFEYNLVGCLSKITNTSGNYVNFQLGPNGKIASVSDNWGRIVSYSYDQNGNLISFTDPMGNTTQYNYDNKNRLIQIMDPRGNAVLSAAYNNDNKVFTFVEKGETYTITYFNDHTVKTDSSGKSWTYYFNDVGIIEKIIDPLGNVKQQHHNKVTSTSVDWEDDLNGNRTTYTYDAYGNIITETDSLGNVWTYTYIPGTDLIVTETDPLGRVMKYEYDESGNQTKIIKDFGGPLENVTVYTYDIYGNTLTETDPLGNITRYEYNENGKCIKKTDPLGTVITYTYDSRGNKLTETDGNGNINTFVYDLMDRLISVTDPLGNITTYTYDANGNKTSITDAKGNVTTFTYDDYNRKIQGKDPLGNTTSFSYDNRDNIISLTDARGNTTFYEYDEYNNLIKETNAEGGIKQYIYDKGLKIKEIDEIGKITYFKYDQKNRLTKVIKKNNDTNDIIDGDDAVTNIIYDAVDNVVSVTDAVGNVTSFEYDSLNRVIKETNAEGEITSTNYDLNGNIISVSLRNDNITNYQYDSLNRLIEINDSIGLMLKRTYDAVGNKLTDTDGTGNTTSYFYDKLNNLIRIIDPMGRNAYREYDSIGNLIKMIDRENNGTSFTYDKIGRKISITDGDNNTTYIQYDEVGNKIRQIDCKGNITSYTYDKCNRLIKEINAEGLTREFIYNSRGDLISEKDYNKIIKNYEYNDLGYLLKRDYPSNDEFFTYDNAGRLISATNSYSQVTFSYDNANRIIMTSQNGKVITYQYNLLDNYEIINYPSGESIKETRDKRYRLLSVTDGASVIILENYYDLGDNLVSQNLSNQIVSTYTYNANDLITSILHQNESVTTSGFEYDFNNEANRIYSKSYSHPDYSEAYSYDNTYSLTSFKRGNLDGNYQILNPITESTFNLDCTGGWISRNVDGIIENRNTNEVNEYTDINGVLQIYDENGNLLDDGSFIYEYDYENRIISISNKTDSSTIVTYKYDALGRRIEKAISGGQTTKYIYEGPRVIEERDENDSVTSLYIYGSEIDDIIMMKKGGNNYFYHKNSLGSIAAITDSSGNVVEEYFYDPYGNVNIIDSTGNIIIESTVENPYMFTGRRYDTESGLYYYRARYYSPNRGCFLQRDPLGYIDGMNLYAYVANNPVNFIDPEGLVRQDCTTHEIRFGFNAPRWLVSVGKKLGMYGVSIYIAGKTTKCTYCCDSGPKYGRMGFSKSIKGSLSVVGKFGSSEFDLWILKIRLGWYGRLSGTGEVFGKYEYCKDNLQGGGCVTVGGEAGLIGEVTVGVEWRDLKVGGGARGGAGVKLTGCIVPSTNDIKLKGRSCVYLRAIVWAKAGKIDYRYHKSLNWCSGWKYF